MMLGHAYEILLAGTMIVLGILIIVSIVRSVLGPGISDRVIAVNMIGTIIIMLIAILSLYLDENYLVDVCLIYAMISFLGVVVLCKVYTGVYLQRKNMKANLGAVADNLRNQEEAAGERAAEAAGESLTGASAAKAAGERAEEAEASKKAGRKAAEDASARNGDPENSGSADPEPKTNAARQKEVQ